MKFAFYSFLATALFAGWILFLVLRSIFADRSGRHAEECTLE